MPAVQYSRAIDAAPASIYGIPLSDEPVNKKTQQPYSKEYWQKLNEYTLAHDLGDFYEITNRKCGYCKGEMCWQEGELICFRSGKWYYDNFHRGDCVKEGRSKKVRDGRKSGQYCFSGFCNCLLSRKKSSLFIPVDPDDDENLARFCSSDCQVKYKGDSNDSNEQVCQSSLLFQPLYSISLILL